MTAVSSRDQFVKTATQLLDEDANTAVVIADISVDRFLPAAVKHPDRVINVGIREQAMIGVAAGLALAGMRVVAHSYATFLVERAYEQIKLDLTHQGLGAVLVSIAGSYDAAAEGRTHQSPGDIALFDTLPGWTVHAPGHPGEIDALVRGAVEGDGQVYVRLSERANERPMRDGATVLRRGEGPLVISFGPLLGAVQEATEGLDATLCHLTTIRPFPARLVADLAVRDVVLVEPALAGTSSAHVGRALTHLPHRLLAFGIDNPELHRYGTPADHDRAHGLDAAGIRASLDRFLRVH